LEKNLEKKKKSRVRVSVFTKKKKKKKKKKKMSYDAEKNNDTLRGADYRDIRNGRVLSGV
jgi:hypothetical protein